MDYWHTPHAPNVQVVLEGVETGNLRASNVLKVTASTSTGSNGFFVLVTFSHSRARKTNDKET